MTKMEQIIKPATPYRIYHDHDKVERDAHGRLDRTAQDGMFDRLDWFKLVAKHTLEGQVLVIRADADGASYWLFLDRNGHRAEALGNWYGLRYGIVSHSPRDPGSSAADIIDGLRAAGVSHLYLEPLSENDPIAAALQKKGWLVRREEINVSWRIDTRDMSFDEYWAGRPSRLRNTAKRKARKAKLEMVFYDKVEDEPWADLEAVFQASWKPPEGSSALIREIATKEGEAGTLRLGLAYKDGKAVAAQIWTVEHGVAIIHKLAYREDAKNLSAGTILSVEMFRRVLDEDKVDLIDFGNGNDTYKREWMDHKVPLYAISAYDPFNWNGLVGLAKATGQKLLSRMGLVKGKDDARSQPRR